MRLIKFNLRGFGQFKNYPFEFDPKKSLHFIYGENESGKTTFTRAYMALLFGIEKKTTDTYLTSTDHLFLEGLFETKSGKYHQVIRQHKLSKKLNFELKSLFPHLTKTQYGENFILNDQTLLSGSKDLIAYLKNFDLNLFHNATGLHQIKSVIKKLGLRAEGLFKSKGTKPLINQNYFGFTGLCESQKGMQLTYQDYEDIRAGLQSLETEKNTYQQKIERLLLKEKVIGLPCALCDALKDLQQVKQKIKDLDGQLASFDHCSTIDPKDWNPIKEELQNFLKVYLIETSHLSSSKEQARQFEKHIVDLKSKLDNTAQVEGLDQLKELFSTLKMHIGLEEEEKQKGEVTSRTRRKIEKRLTTLNLSFSSFSKCLEMVFPSRSDLDGLSESHYSISHLHKELSSKREELKKQNLDISIDSQKIAKQASFNLESYQTTKKERIHIGLQTLKDWSSNSSEVSFNLVQKYQSLVNNESGFTDLVLKESDAFVHYKELEQFKKKSDIETERLNELELKLRRQKDLMAKTLSLYRKKWGLEALSYSQLKDICAEVPVLQNTIKSFLSNSEELKSISSEISRIKKLLKEKMSAESCCKRSLRELFDDLQKKILQMTRDTQVYEEIVNKLGESERHLQLSHKSSLTRMNSFEELSKKWRHFLDRVNLSLNLDEPSIRSFLQKFECFIQRSIQKTHLKEDVLDEKNKHVKQLYKQMSEKNWEEWNQESWTKLLHPSFVEKESFVDLEVFRVDLESIRLKINREFSQLRDQLSEVDQKLGRLQFQKSSMNKKSSQKEIEALLQDHLFHLESHIENYLTAKLSEHLLKSMVRGYQDQYQEPLLEKVSQNFSDLTSGRYERVKLNILDQESYLTCTSKSGEVPVNKLSHGTRDQLFLSLKLALIEQMQDGQEPMPILLDDILVQFDEPRALQALEVLKNLSKKSQIIFLTHHRHILELAEKGISKEDYQVHALKDSISV